MKYPIVLRDVFNKNGNKGTCQHFFVIDEDGLWIINEEDNSFQECFETIEQVEELVRVLENGLDIMRTNQ